MISVIYRKVFINFWELVSKIRFPKFHFHSDYFSKFLRKSYWSFSRNRLFLTLPIPLPPNVDIFIPDPTKWKWNFGNLRMKTNQALTLRRPLRRKVRMRWFFDVFQVKESSFFISDLTDPPSDFWCASFGKYYFKPFKISFFIGFYTKIMFGVRWFYSLFERMRLWSKKLCFFTLTNLYSYHFI